MKKTKIRLLSLLLAALALLTACSGGAFDLTYSDGAYRNAKKEVAFYAAPVCYRAVSILDNEAAAVLKSDYADNVVLYAVYGMDTLSWLADEDFMLYYEDRITLPTLRQMNPSYVTLSYVSYPVEISRLESAASLNTLITLYETTPAIPGDRISSAIPEARDRYELLFFTKEAQYAGISYSLEYWKFDEEVAVYSRLNADGTAPDTCPGVTPTIEEVSGERVAVFRLGTGLVYDRSAHCFYPFGSQLEDLFNND